MNKLLEKMQNTGTIKDTYILNESKLFKKEMLISTEIPILNTALSGELDGGMSSGLLIVAGPSRMFKSMISIYMIKAYLNEYPDAICLFYDSEFGTTPSYFKSLGVDTNKILHIPIKNIEELKFDIIKKIEQIEKNDKVIIFLDSLGSIASKKEIEDAMDEKSVADMTRAKAIRSLLRIVSPHLILKNIPMIAVNHVYDQIGPMYPTKVMGGGTSIMYSANAVWFMSRRQDTEGSGIKKELTGYEFVITIEKSRFIKEKSKLILDVSFENGISKWSGLLDIALESGHVTKPAKGWYQKTGFDTKYRESDTNTEDFWSSIIDDPTFKKYIKDHYQLGETTDLI